ncbi:MAG: CoA pyrophosphatase [Hyphomicrobiaceae bacterium]|nr:CoA pyrophosphatase [Hyphomicrobiaceae bacterium]
MSKQNRQENGFAETRFKIEARRRLRQQLCFGANADEAVTHEDFQQDKKALCPAAVLVPIVNHHDRPHILLTRRADDHPHHAGQISFPGGKIAGHDKNIEATALRETFEETGVEAKYIELLGHLERHDTGTGFCIYPVVGLLDPAFTLRPCAREVAEIFEVPLDYLMSPDNYRLEKLFWGGVERRFYVIDYGTYRIWGATAAILKMLQERLFEQK